MEIDKICWWNFFSELPLSQLRHSFFSKYYEYAHFWLKLSKKPHINKKACKITKKIVLILWKGLFDNFGSQSYKIFFFVLKLFHVLWRCVTALFKWYYFITFINVGTPTNNLRTNLSFSRPIAVIGLPLGLFYLCQSTRQSRYYIYRMH